MSHTIDLNAEVHAYNTGKHTNPAAFVGDLMSELARAARDQPGRKSDALIQELLWHAFVAYLPQVEYVTRSFFSAWTDDELTVALARARAQLGPNLRNNAIQLYGNLFH